MSFAVTTAWLVGWQAVEYLSYGMRKISVLFPLLPVILPATFSHLPDSLSLLRSYSLYLLLIGAYRVSRVLDVKGGKYLAYPPIALRGVGVTPRGYYFKGFGSLKFNINMSFLCRAKNVNYHWHDDTCPFNVYSLGSLLLAGCKRQTPEHEFVIDQGRDDWNQVSMG